MSQAKKQYVVVFGKSWWIEGFVAFGPFTSKVKAAKAMAALNRSDWYRGTGYVKGGPHAQGRRTRTHAARRPA